VAIQKDVQAVIVRTPRALMAAVVWSNPVRSKVVSTLRVVLMREPGLHAPTPTRTAASFAKYGAV